MKLKFKPKTETAPKPKRKNSFLKTLGKAAVIGIISGSLMLGCGAGNIYTAAESGDFNEVKKLLSKGADVNARDRDGGTAIMAASYHGHIDMVRLLLKRGADANAGTDFGWTALMSAAREGHIDVVRLLLDNGAYVDAQSVGNPNSCVTTFLGITYSVSCMEGRMLSGNWTASQWASYEGHDDIVELLKEYGAK